MPDVGVLIPAGGTGERAGPGEPKQFRAIAGQPMLLRTLRPFAAHTAVGQIVVALPETFAAGPPPWLADLAGERLRIVAGGPTRAQSVHRALAALDPSLGIVLVHDAARPFVTVEEIDAVIGVAREGAGAVPAIPVTDTLKRALDDGRVVETVQRAGLWRALTPQGFPRALLERAFVRAARENDWRATDDAGMVEALGAPIRIVRGAARNIKVTRPEDFVLAETLVR